MSGTDTQRVLYCIGAQKAGTSWLAGYARAHPNLHCPETKELHYFEAIRGADRYQTIKKRRDVALSILSKLPDKPGAVFDHRYAKLERYIRLLGMYLSGEQGARNYQAILAEGSMPGQILCDFTPAYSVLDRTAFAAMEAQSPGAKFLLILRDPVDRLWSSIRMSARRKTSSDESFRSSALETARRFASETKPGVPRRSDYSAMIRELDAAIAPASVRYLFYEDLFKDETLRQLCDFLDIPYVPGEVSTAKNEGKPLALDEDLKLGFLKRLMPQYEFCMERFPSALPRRWAERMELHRGATV